MPSLVGSEMCIRDRFVATAARPGSSLHTPIPTCLFLNLSSIDTVSRLLPSEQVHPRPFPFRIILSNTCSVFFSRSIHVELDPKPKLPPSDRHYARLVYFPPLASLPHSGGCLFTSRKYWLCAIKGPRRPFNNPLRFFFTFLTKNVFSAAAILFAV